MKKGLPIADWHVVCVEKTKCEPDAGAQGVKIRNGANISTAASITAKVFFEKRGYVVQKEQSIKCKEEYLTNFKMQKIIQGSAK